MDQSQQMQAVAANPECGTPGNALPGVPSLLDSKETTQHACMKHSYREFLISGDRQAIAAARALYEQIDARDGKHRTIKFNTCRSFARFVRHKQTGEIRVASSRCKLRWCPLCRRSDRYIITQSVKSWLESGVKGKFLTLTLKHSKAPLSEQIDRLYKSFARMLW